MLNCTSANVPHSTTTHYKGKDDLPCDGRLCFVALVRGGRVAVGCSECVVRLVGHGCFSCMGDGGGKPVVVPVGVVSVGRIEQCLFLGGTAHHASWPLFPASVGVSPLDQPLCGGQSVALPAVDGCWKSVRRVSAAQCRRVTFQPFSFYRVGQSVLPPRVVAGSVALCGCVVFPIPFCPFLLCRIDGDFVSLLGIVCLCVL